MSELALKLDQPTVQVLPDSVMRRLTRESLNRLVDITDWRMDGDLIRIMKELNEGPYIHRKSWEYAMCIHGFDRLGAIKPESHCLGVAAGYERPLFYYANRCARMVATDLYNCPENEGKPEMLTNPQHFAPFPYREDHLEVYAMDATELAFPDESFDATFSLSSIEHFGSRENSKRSMREMYRVLKPGGFACIATELILNGATHPEYFTYEEYKDVILDSTPFRQVGGELDLRISRSLIDYPTNLEYAAECNVCPLLVLKQNGVMWTSLMCFLQK